MTIDYGRESVAEKALAWTAGRGVDILFDAAFGTSFAAAFPALKPYGHAVTINEPPLPQDAVDVAKRRNITINFELMLTPMLFGLHDRRIAQRQMLETAARMIDDGELRVIASHILPLAHAGEAHRLLEAGRMTGKVVLEIA